MTHAPVRAAAAYGRASQAIPPVRQVVMLYDGAIDRLREARQAIVDRRVEDRFHAVSKASAIVDGLHACLDFERGGAIAPLLDRMYGYVALRMQQINTRDDPAICDELAARLTDLRDAWQAIASGTAPGLHLPASAEGSSIAA